MRRLNFLRHATFHTFLNKEREYSAYGWHAVGDLPLSNTTSKLKHLVEVRKNVENLLMHPDDLLASSSRQY